MRCCFRNVLLVAVSTGLVCCSGSGEDGDNGHSAASSTDRVTVAAVNYPLAFFAERLGGDAVTVIFAVPSDVDPAHWKPSRKDIARYQSADIILFNGDGYAAWTARTSLPQERIVDTVDPFDDNLLSIEGAAVHSHGPQGQHSHSAAYTTWLDLNLALQQAQAVRDALVEHGVDAATVDANLAQLTVELETLDNDLSLSGTNMSRRPMLASHPIYSYLARAYGLNIRSVVWEPDEAPSEDEWAQLAQVHKAFPARVMLWEKEPLPATRERLGRMGITTFVYDPCMNRPDAGDLLSVMRENIARLAAAVQ